MQQREELLGFSGHAAADDDQVRPEQVLDVGVVPLKTLGPLLPGQVLVVFDARGRALLSVAAVDLEMPELGVGDQHAVVEQRRSDAGSQSAHQNEPGGLARGPEVELAHPRRISVIDYRDRSAELVAQQPSCVCADPGSCLLYTSDAADEED